MNQLGNKFGIIGPSFTLMAMILMITGKPVESPFVWAGYAMILACLVLMNISYTKLYEKAKALLGHRNVQMPASHVAEQK